MLRFWVQFIFWKGFLRFGVNFIFGKVFLGYLQCSVSFEVRILEFLGSFIPMPNSTLLQKVIRHWNEQTWKFRNLNLKTNWKKLKNLQTPSQKLNRTPNLRTPSQKLNWTSNLTTQYTQIVFANLKKVRSKPSRIHQHTVNILWASKES